jgi:hypothetical protein
MFKNYFKTAWRNLYKEKGFSAINIMVGHAQMVGGFRLPYRDRLVDLRYGRSFRPGHHHHHRQLSGYPGSHGQPDSQPAFGISRAGQNGCIKIVQSLYQKRTDRRVNDS